jgi:hypothetical protein
MFLPALPLMLTKIVPDFVWYILFAVLALVLAAGGGAVYGWSSARSDCIKAENARVSVVQVVERIVKVEDRAAVQELKATNSALAVKNASLLKRISNEAKNRADKEKLAAAELAKRNTGQTDPIVVAEAGGGAGNCSISPGLLDAFNDALSGGRAAHGQGTDGVLPAEDRRPADNG